MLSFTSLDTKQFHQLTTSTKEEVKSDSSSGHSRSITVSHVKSITEEVITTESQSSTKKAEMSFSVKTAQDDSYNGDYQNGRFGNTTVVTKAPVQSVSEVSLNF